MRYIARFEIVLRNIEKYQGRLGFSSVIFSYGPRLIERSFLRQDSGSAIQSCFLLNIVASSSLTADFLEATMFLGDIYGLCVLKVSRSSDFTLAVNKVDFLVLLNDQI